MAISTYCRFRRPSDPLPTVDNNPNPGADVAQQLAEQMVRVCVLGLLRDHGLIALLRLRQAAAAVVQNGALEILCDSHDVSSLFKVAGAPAPDRSRPAS